MTLLLSEAQVTGLLEMGEVVRAVEQVFLKVGQGEGVNAMRTRSMAKGASLSVMHASLPYLGRAGLKFYMGTRRGTRFLVALFDTENATPLAIMGADMLGRFRTGAASAVATKHLYRKRSARLAVFGSGRQALTQVLALGSVMSLDEVRVWSPSWAHREAFVARLGGLGYNAAPSRNPKAAAEGSEVGSTITSSRAPFLGADEVAGFSHLNLCGGNHPKHSEMTPEAVSSFDGVYVDDISQAKLEYGDLIAAESVGRFAWESARELSDVVSGKLRPRGRTLFKSGGVAICDVAVASMVYDKASEAGAKGPESFDFG